MHPVFFGIKRVHLRVLALTRPLLREAVLTPARFDMLRIVGNHPRGILQRNIQYLLGVSAATVSRMLRSLELLGNVVRRTYERDRRCRLVYLTAVGDDALMRAGLETIDVKVDRTMVAHGITGVAGVDLDSAPVLQQMRALEDRLMRARRAYEDPSPVRHPWAQAPIAFMEDSRFLDGTADYPPEVRPFVYEPRPPVGFAVHPAAKAG